MSGEQIAALVAAAVAVFWVLGAYNRLVAMRNAIGQAWAKVDETLRQRAATVAALVAALREPLAAEQGALDALLAAQGAGTQATEALATRIVSAPRAEAWRRAEGVLTAAASRVLALVEQQAELRQHEALAALVRDWHAQQPRLAFARQLFNETAGAYDEALALFPTRLLVRLFGFERAGRL